jgi:hypothetical protein
VLAILTDAADHAHHQRGVHRGWQALADDVSYVESGAPVGQKEEAGEVSAGFTEWRETIGNLEEIGDQRAGRKKRPLDLAGFFVFKLSDALGRLTRRCGREHVRYSAGCVRR